MIIYIQSPINANPVNYWPKFEIILLGSPNYVSIRSLELSEIVEDQKGVICVIKEKVCHVN